jgi:hypothetical protein
MAHPDPNTHTASPSGLLWIAMGMPVVTEIQYTLTAGLHYAQSRYLKLPAMLHVTRSAVPVNPSCNLCCSR